MTQKNPHPPLSELTKTLEPGGLAPVDVLHTLDQTYEQTLKAHKAYIYDSEDELAEWQSPSDAAERERQAATTYELEAEGAAMLRMIAHGLGEAPLAVERIFQSADNGALGMSPHTPLFEGVRSVLKLVAGAADEIPASGTRMGLLNTMVGIDLGARELAKQNDKPEPEGFPDWDAEQQDLAIALLARSRANERLSGVAEHSAMLRGLPYRRTDASLSPPMGYYALEEYSEWHHALGFALALQQAAMVAVHSLVVAGMAARERLAAGEVTPDVLGFKEGADPEGVAKYRKRLDRGFLTLDNLTHTPATNALGAPLHLWMQQPSPVAHQRRALSDTDALMAHFKVDPAAVERRIEEAMKVKAKQVGLQEKLRKMQQQIAETLEAEGNDDATSGEG